LTNPLLDRLAAVNKVEADVSARAEGRNLLEGYLYRLSGLLGPDAHSDALHRFGTEEERQKLTAGVEHALGWMNGEGETADVQTLLNKRADLE
jgi:hypoxia up-regulated 1